MVVCVDMHQTRYLPSASKSQQHFGAYVVDHLDNEIYQSEYLIIRTYTVSSKKEGKQLHKFKHFHFLGWPDF